MQLFTHLQFYIGYNGQKVITSWVPGFLKSQTSEAEGLTNAWAFVAVTSLGTLRFKTATHDDDAETNYFKQMTGQKSCRILSIV